MNFFTESLDFPQNEQRRCLSLGMMAPCYAGKCPPPGIGARRWRFTLLLVRVHHRRRAALALMLHHVVDQTVLHRVLRAHEPVPLYVLRDPLLRLTRMLG